MYIITDEMKKQLIGEAIKMLARSYIPYSHFAVGAALLTKDDKIYTGCNIENAALAPGNCAERTAFFKAISEGEREFKAIAIVGGKDREVTDYCSPCGVCRQVMREFCVPSEFVLLLAKNVDDYKEVTLEEMLPMGFGPENLR